MYISLTVNLELPKGSVIVDISPHRLSYWTRTARIRTLDPEENKVSYFLKVSQQDTSLQRFGPEPSRRYVRAKLERVWYLENFIP
jgi:hypothetical protein